MESGRVQSYDQPILGLVSVWREHEPIYTANIDKIGMLSKRDASRIVTFHEILNLVKKDQLTLPKYSPEAQKIALRLHAEWLRAACELGEIIGNEAKIDVSLDVVRMRKPADETLG